MLGGERMDLRPCRHLDGDAQRVRDVARAHRVEQLRQVGAQLGKVEMAVRIDEHGAPSAEACAQGAASDRRPRLPDSEPTSCASCASTRATRRGSSRSSSSRCAPVSSCVNCTPMPCVRLPCTPSGVIQTTLPCTAILLGSSISDSSMNTSSPSAYGRDVGMKMPPPRRNGMYAAYSAARSRMLSDSTPGRAALAPPVAGEELCRP